MKKKIKPSHKYTYITFFILFCALTLLLWTIVGTKPWLNNYTDYIKERLWVELTYISSAFLVNLIGVIIYRIKVYYVVDDKKIIRYGRVERQYFYNDIIYVDDEYTSKHNDALIYLNTGKWINLTLDSKRELLELIKDKSPLMKKDDFILKYPEAYQRIKKR